MKTCFRTSPHQLSLTLQLHKVIGIVAAVKFLDCSCAFCDFPFHFFKIFKLKIFFFFFNFGRKVGGGGHLTGLLLPSSLDPSDKDVYCTKLPVWLIVVVEIAAAVEYLITFMVSVISLMLF